MKEKLIKTASELAKKIKILEKGFEQVLPGDRPYVVRLDGVNFRSYTSTLDKPFDKKFTDSLINTTKALMERTGAILGFCQSDEITLIGGPATNDDSKNHLYGGRTQKIASVLASVAACEFYYENDINKNNDVSVAPKRPLSYFDARVFSVPDWETVAQVLMWRHRFDCRRNALNSIALKYFSSDSIQGKSLKSVIEKIELENNINIYTEFPHENVYGTFLKRVQYTIIGENPISGEKIPTVRTRIEGRSFDWIEEDTEKILEFVKNPFFN